jgi:hypothetical protein
LWPQRKKGSNHGAASFFDHPWLLAYEEDNLAKRAFREVLIRVTRLLKQVEMVDHRRDSMLVQELIHTVKRGSRRNLDAAGRGLTEDQWQTTISEVSELCPDDQ